MAAVSPGVRANTRAATPVTCGVAIDVPSAKAYTGLPAPEKSQAVESTPSVASPKAKFPPGARMPTYEPKFEYAVGAPSGPTAATPRTSG